MNEIALTLDQLRRASPGGIGTYVRGLVRGLSTLSADVTSGVDLVGVIPSGPAPTDLDPLNLHLRTLALPERICTQLWGWWAYGIPSSADVVHATSMAGPFAGGRRDAVHSVLVHDLLWRDYPELATRRGARFHEARLARIATRESLRVLVTSAPLADALVDAGVHRERVHVVRLGVERYEEPIDRARVLSDSRVGAIVGPDGHYCVAVGTIQPRKNLERLIAAHTRARQVQPELGPLLLVGARGWGAVDTTGAYELGALDDATVRALVHCARVTAYVALEEGWGLPPVEALGEGRPSVVSVTVPSVAHNDQVIHVNPLDVDDITQGLLRAIELDDDEPARDRRRASVSELDWVTCARDHLAAWA